MSIKLENYEALLLDYIEGRLDAQTALALQRFIQQHPELGSWEELTGELPELEAERVLFDQKEALKKPEIIACEGIDESNFGEMFSAWHEGELTESQRQAVAKFLSLNPSLEDDFRLAGMVYLRPDEKIVFAGKSELMRKAVVVKLLTARYISAAASIVLMFTLGWWWMGRTPTDKQSPAGCGGC
ncbi:MAG: hypothetical protein IPM52_00445 [Bacteroidetes bacterium]|nr:hypothetical protein [Bacteroidota bacterium]